MNNIVYLPIEIKSRDFQNKLLLSYFLLQDGFEVFLGRKKEIEILASNFHPGIYFGINTQKNYIKFYKKIKKKNHKIFLFDEEGLVTLPHKTYASIKANRDIIGVSDIFFCWGETQLSKILKQKKIDKKKLILSGSLRIELLKKKYDYLFKDTVKKIQTKYKNIQLFISSYGYSNHFLDSEKNINNLIKLDFLKKKYEINDYKKYINYNKIRFENYIKNLEKIKNKSKNQIVIRPHPSENHNFYINKFKKKKFLITSKFSVIEWIKASKSIIHDYCTTSFEANILQKKTYYFSNFDKNFFLNKDVYKLSSKFENSFRNTNYKEDDIKKKILKKNIHNYKNISSLNIICEIFKKFKKKTKLPFNRSKIIKSKIFLNYYSLKINKYTNHKAPFIKKIECIKFLKKIKKIENKKNKFVIREFSKNIIFMRPN